MKKIILVALAALPVIAFAQEVKFNLTGHIGKVDKPAMVYMNYRTGGKIVHDSTAVTNGNFQFKGTIGSPVKAQIVMDYAGVGLERLTRGLDILTIYLEKGDLTLSSVDSVKHAVIAGSKLNADYLAYTQNISVPEQQMAAINARYIAASVDQRKNPEVRRAMREEIDKAAKEEQALQYQYIKQNPNSYISLMVLAETAGSSVDFSETESAYKNLSAELRESKTGLNIKKFIESARATAIGAMAPVFTQNDVNDRPVSLSDFKGKYVLLDFWASWCGPCRAENPNVVKAYQQYKNKKFTVLGVSLDQPGKKEAWLAAIKADGLDWPQVSDLKFWNNEVAKKYDIRSIPRNFLIDPTGKIVGKNLRGEALSKKLSELFDQP